MKHDIEQRACDLAVYIIENRTTVRAAAKQFGISKSTVHKDLTERLPQYNRPLSLQVQAGRPPGENTWPRSTARRRHSLLAIQGGKATRKQRYLARQRCVSRCRAARFARETGALLHLTKLRTKIF